MADELLRRYYDERSWEAGFPARCHMELSRRQLDGKHILNVGCRRGKGTYKLSELVGPTGYVIGIDWNASFIEAPRAGIPRALERNHLPRSNMEFRVGFPENLAGASIAGQWVDHVYLNSSLVLFASLPRVLAECQRVLVPGGVLLLEIVVAIQGHAERSAVIEAVRAIPNAVQAPLTRDELMGWLVDAGFQMPLLREERDVESDRGSAFDHRIPTVPADDATYRLIVLEARKLR